MMSLGKITITLDTHMMFAVLIKSKGSAMSALHRPHFL